MGIRNQEWHSASLLNRVRRPTDLSGGRATANIESLVSLSPYSPDHSSTNSIQMSSHSLDHKHDRPCASLSRARPLFVEMLRQIQEERESEVAFFNSKIDGANLGFSVAALAGGEIFGTVSGETAVQDGCGLSPEGQERLFRRGWALPDEEDERDTVPSRHWEGVTSRTDRRHLAKEMLSVATGIYGISEEQKIRFQLRRDGTESPSEVATA